MIRFFALAAIAFAPFATPALAQQAPETCDRTSRVVLDRAQPNESVDVTEKDTPQEIIVSRFLVVPTDNCGPAQQETQMQVVQTQGGDAASTAVQ